MPKGMAWAFGVIELPRFDRIGGKSRVQLPRTSNENVIRSELKELARRVVEGTLIALFEEEVDDPVDAVRGTRGSQSARLAARPLRERAHHHIGAVHP